MTDTAQPVTAAETEVVSDTFADAANAFKQSLGQAERPRDEQGRFAATQEEIDAGEEQSEPAETDETQPDVEEAAEEAQPDPVDMPSSWAKEDAEIWTALPPEAQQRIREREGQRDAAVNQKFQEAANVRKANEALIEEARTNREKFIDAADTVLSLVQLERPIPQQFGAGTGQYDREGYDLAVAQYEQASRIVQQVKAQRDTVSAQRDTELESETRARFEASEAVHRPELFKLVPELTDPSKQGQVIRELAQYSIEQGIPEDVFTNPQIAERITSAELKMAWKARQWDMMQKAKTKVAPRAPVAPSPTVRPGAQPTRSGIQQQQRQKDFARLDKSGSVQDGATVFKHFLKGMK